MWLFPALLFLLLPGCLTAQNEVTGPKTKSGLEQGSLTVQCNYTSGWKTYKKYWCRGAVWRDCKILVSTNRTEQEVKKDRVSIRDDQEKLMFMVTMEDLRRDDADIYWCAVERVGSNHMFPVNVTIYPGYSTAKNEVTGPKTKSGPERGSLTVQCNYTSGWKTHKKYWCRGAVWSSCKTLVKTTGSEQEVKKDRVSIRDDQENLTFMVTMEDLRRDDADIYWCAIERVGSDHGFSVDVTIDPAPTTASPTTTVPNTSTSTTNMSTAPVVEEKTTCLSTHPATRHPITELRILLPLIFAGLMLLLMAASLLAWRMMRRQKKDAGLSPEQALQPLEEDLCYANLSVLQPRSSASSSRKKASAQTFSSAQADQEEVEYVTMPPLPREDISYASLSLDLLDQEPTYSNTGHIPSRDHEEPTEYSVIRKS